MQNLSLTEERASVEQCCITMEQNCLHASSLREAFILQSEV